MKINNKQFYSYEEIKEVALNAMRDEIIRKCNETDRKYIVDMDNIIDNKTRIGLWLSKNGYIKILKQENKIRKYYYIKLDDFISDKN